MVELTSLGENLMDAYKWHQEVKEKFPKYADDARQILLNYLNKYDPDNALVFIGKEDNHFEWNNRTWLYWVQRDICSYLEDVDTLTSPCGNYIGAETLIGYKLRWDHHIREKLRLPFSGYEITAKNPVVYGIFPDLPLKIVYQETIEEVESLLNPKRRIA